MESDYQQISREWKSLTRCGSRDATEERRLVSHTFPSASPSKTPEGGFVVVHFHVRHGPGDLGAAVAHIFRFEEGRIVELWDLGQPVPEESPNRYGMF